MHKKMRFMSADRPMCRESVEFSAEPLLIARVPSPSLAHQLSGCCVFVRGGN